MENRLRLRNNAWVAWKIHIQSISQRIHIVDMFEMAGMAMMHEAFINYVLKKQ